MRETTKTTFACPLFCLMYGHTGIIKVILISGHTKSMRTALFGTSMTIGMVVPWINAKLFIQRVVSMSN